MRYYHVYLNGERLPIAYRKHYDAQRRADELDEQDNDNRLYVALCLNPWCITCDAVNRDREWVT